MTLPLGRTWLLIALMLVAFANVWPLDLAQPSAWPSRARDMVLRAPDVGTLLTIGVWSVLGLLAAAAAPGRRGLMAVVVMAAALGIEASETIVDGRHAGLLDGVLAGLAGIAALTFGGRLALRLNHILARLRLPALVVLAVAAPLLTALSDRRQPFDNWVSDFPLVVGQEATHGRVWNGEVFQAAIYAAAPTTREAERLTTLDWAPEGRSTRISLGARVLCTPGGEPLAPDGCGVDTSDTKALVTAIQSTGAVAVEFVAASTVEPQNAWPRIVTLSPDPWRRNLTVGQWNDALYLRVRTPWSGSNGLRQGVTLWGDVFTTPGPHHVLVSYDGHSVAAFVDGRALPPRALYWPHFAAGHDGLAGDAALAMLIGLAAGMLCAGLAGAARIATIAVLPTLAGLSIFAAPGALIGAVLLQGIIAAACVLGLAVGRGPGAPNSKGTL